MADIILPEVKCSTAEEFLQALSPIGEYFKDQDIDAPWLFRGQGKDYSLIPSLFRKNGKIKTLTRRDVDKYSELLLSERDILIKFFQIADKRGLILPDDSQELRSYLERLNDDDGAVAKGLQGWRVSEKALSLVALAQHYGIPTRLLDWTRQASIAAFFAGDDSYKYADKVDKSSRLVVWAFQVPILGKITMYSEDSYILRIITAPSATNINLKAQQGVFTLTHFYYTEESTGEYLPLDAMLKKQSDEYPEMWDGFRMMKFTLPTSEASHLLHLLAKLDITHSAIYPGYQSILSDLQMQNSWD